MTDTTASGPGKNSSRFIIIGCGLAIIAIAVGIQQTFGLFLRPVSEEMGWGREILSLALAGFSKCAQVITDDVLGEFDGVAKAWVDLPQWILLMLSRF